MAYDSIKSNNNHYLQWSGSLSPKCFNLCNPHTNSMGVDILMISHFKDEDTGHRKSLSIFPRLQREEVVETAFQHQQSGSTAFTLKMMLLHLSHTCSTSSQAIFQQISHRNNCVCVTPELVNVFAIQWSFIHYFTSEETKVQISEIISIWLHSHGAGGPVFEFSSIYFQD